MLLIGQGSAGMTLLRCLKARCISRGFRAAGCGRASFCCRAGARCTQSWSGSSSIVGLGSVKID
jgi:hypothetical protein